MTVLRKSFYIHWSAGRSPQVHEVNPGRDPSLVINYKPLNKVLQWIRHPIPNKKDLIQRIYNAIIFSKFDMKSGFWQIQIKPEDRYRTAFTVPFGHYEWNVMPFGLKKAPSEF